MTMIVEYTSAAGSGRCRLQNIGRCCVKKMFGKTEDGLPARRVIACRSAGFNRGLPTSFLRLRQNKNQHYLESW